MKGVLLAGGEGTRLRPLTLVTNKHLLPVYDIPMIVHPLRTLKALGIEDILIVTGGNHIGRFAEFLGDGSEFEVNLTYRVQKKAGGIAEALGLAEGFSSGQKVTVILGDNIFERSRIQSLFKKEWATDNSTILFAKKVSDPERFGVVEFDGDGKALSIEEKPAHPKSSFAVTGLYIYPNDVFEIIKTLTPSKRDELEITDVNMRYLERKQCVVEEFDGFWSDSGTFDSLLRSANWVKENREG